MTRTRTNWTEQNEDVASNKVAQNGNQLGSLPVAAHSQKQAQLPSSYQEQVYPRLKPTKQTTRIQYMSTALTPMAGYSIKLQPPPGAMTITNSDHFCLFLFLLPASIPCRSFAPLFPTEPWVDAFPVLCSVPDVLCVPLRDLDACGAFVALCPVGCCALSWAFFDDVRTCCGAWSTFNPSLSCLRHLSVTTFDLAA
jgi:hypothetical protein